MSFKKEIISQLKGYNFPIEILVEIFSGFSCDGALVGSPCLTPWRRQDVHALPHGPRLGNHLSPPNHHHRHRHPHDHHHNHHPH